MRNGKNWFTLLLLLFTVPVSAADQKIEVPILNVLLPTVGYDDNDTIEAVLTGDLPSPCFSLAEATAERTADGFRFRQYAWYRTEGACGSGDLIEDPVPFSTELGLGRLAQGNYLLKYDQNSVKTFMVSRAPVARIDTFNYASISNASVGALHLSGKKVRFTLIGILSSSCVRLEDPIEVKQVGEVFIVLPVLENDSKGCEPNAVPFQKVIDLGRPKPGEYLIHVRSRNGKAVNRVFTVLAPSS